MNLEQRKELDKKLINDLERLAKMKAELLTKVKECREMQIKVMMKKFENQSEINKSLS